jgi:hypothetical protein
MTGPSSAQFARQLRQSAEECRKEAARLEEEATRLENAARVLQAGPQSNGHPQSPKTQVAQLTDFLRERGPLTRSQIKAAGVNDSILKNWLRAEFFDKDEQGRWSVKEAK